MALSTSTDGSIAGQTNTQSPQTSASTGTSAAPASRVQPGTASSLLARGDGSPGVPLTGTELSVVSLNTSPQTTHSSTGQESKPKTVHHVNAGLLIIAISLFAIAVVVFGLTSRSAKNTTKY